MKRFNQETAYELEKWDINKTNRPASCSTRLYTSLVPQVQLRDGRGGLDPRVMTTSEKGHKLTYKAYSDSPRAA